ncbi:hypothetical protein C1645_731699 [Glomus cerebriforme]|uniref:Uncharacterized protein n=1 Tax=Glomus cerebriforme TaxID=658196 RepID=A0A397TPM7_9GLOM|nr:hypothetical protein C1645_731699 [Glomus cerebriforme]
MELSRNIVKNKRIVKTYIQNVSGILQKNLRYINKYTYELVILDEVKHEGFLNNGQYIILCATKEQTKAISELTHIEINMAYKRIYGITNKWEVVTYLPQVQKRLGYILANQYKEQALVPTLNTQEEVLEILNKICNSNEPETIAWVKDKLIPWVLSGISSAFSKMDHII